MYVKVFLYMIKNMVFNNAFNKVVYQSRVSKSCIKDIIFNEKFYLFVRCYQKNKKCPTFNNRVSDPRPSIPSQNIFTRDL